MKVCFIADSSSLHVQRIVAHFVRNQDDILILSSARRPFFITGVNIVHLLYLKKFSTFSTHELNTLRTRLSIPFKQFAPKPLKIFILHVLNLFRNLGLIFQYKFICHMVDQFNPDVVFCNRTFPEGFLALGVHSKPLLIRTAGPDISKLTKYPIYRQLIRRAVLAADIIVTQSTWERKLLQTLCKGKVDVKIMNIGVDTKIFHQALSRKDLRYKYGLPPDAFIVVSNRYLDGHYNGWLVVKVIQSILKSCPNLVLLYASPLKMNAETKMKAQAISRQFPQIIFLDGPSPHPQLANILRCGDVFTSFSSFDGIPNSLLEAMACGLVPIVAELPQLHEWIIHGWNGYMVPQRDTKRLAAVIQSTYHNQEMLTTMSARCIKIIEEQATYDSCMGQMRKLAERLVQSGHECNG
jgi:L-malate glycosyltransferase